MKTTTKYPYNFYDYTRDGTNFVTYDISENNLNIQVNLETFEFFKTRGVDFAIELENTQTFYRELVILTNDKFSLDLEYQNVGDQVKYTLMMIASEEGKIDFGNGVSNFHERGDCIGVLQKDTITLKKERGLTGLIKFARGGNSIAYDLTNDWITIELPPKTHEQLQVWISDKGAKPYVLSSFATGCIQYALMMAKNEGSFRDRSWFARLSRMTRSKGIDLDEIENYEIPNATNVILGNCMEKMVNTALPTIDTEDLDSFS